MTERFTKVLFQRHIVSVISVGNPTVITWVDFY